MVPMVGRKATPEMLSTSIDLSKLDLNWPNGSLT